MKLAVMHPSKIAGNAVSVTLSRTFEKVGIPCETSLYGSSEEFRERYGADSPFDKVFLRHSPPNALDPGSAGLSGYLHEHGYMGELFLLSDKAMDASAYNFYKGKHPVKMVFSGNLTELMVGMRNYFQGNI
jgi:hypothetical protein